MIECMRAELEPQGIICSAFCPGAVQSNIAESGKTRPAALAATGYAEADKRRQQLGSFFHLFSTKEAIGQRVLQGILSDELYIMTHSEFRQGVEERAQAMCAAVPDAARERGIQARLQRAVPQPDPRRRDRAPEEEQAMKDFAGRTAFVTGGAHGVGIGLVRALLAQGCNVAIADIRAGFHRCGPEGAGQPEGDGRAGGRVLAPAAGACRGCRWRLSSGPSACCSTTPA